jgi:Na+-transporting methylmalonyl-CoA/oxaloacetate decarboxylase gamma subunit
MTLENLSDVYSRIQITPPTPEQEKDERSKKAKKEHNHMPDQVAQMIAAIFAAHTQKQNASRTA